MTASDWPKVAGNALWPIWEQTKGFVVEQAPTVLIGIGIGIGGWLAARIIRRVVDRVLRAIKLNAAVDKTRIGANERLNLFTRAVRELPPGVPVNVMLFPMNGDFNAPISFWSLALSTKGSFLTVSRDWP